MCWRFFGITMGFREYVAIIDATSNWKSVHEPMPPRVGVPDSENVRSRCLIPGPGMLLCRRDEIPLGQALERRRGEMPIAKGADSGSPFFNFLSFSSSYHYVLPVLCSPFLSPRAPLRFCTATCCGLCLILFAIFTSF